MPSSVIIGSGGSGGGSGSNASVGVNGAVAPTSSTEIGFINGSGNEVGVSATNPLPVTGTITASNPSVGLTGATAPTSATEIGVIDISGKLQGASASNPVRIDPTGTTLQPVSGTITAVTTITNAVKIVGNIGGIFDAVVGAAVPANAIQVGGSDGTDLRALLTSATGQLHILADSGSTTAVTQATASNLNAAVVGTKTNNNAAPGATNIGTLGAIANAVGQTWTEGDQVALSTDLNGSTRVMAGVIAETTTAWTSATAQNTALTMTVTGYSSVIVTFNFGSTFTGGQAVFEGSDASTNWYPITGILHQNNIGSAVAVFPNTTFNFSGNANTNKSWLFNVSGFVSFRVRLGTVISGTGTVNVGLQASSLVAAPINYGATAIQNSTSQIIFADNLVNATQITDSNGTRANFAVAQTTYGGTFSGAADAARQGWSKTRTPTVFKTVQATASGNTAVWTPGSGNKFRILKVMVQVTDNASLASGAVLTISFQDNTTAMPIAFDIFVPTTAVTTTAGAAFTQELDLGEFGILSAAANNVFNVNLSAALATGNARIIAMGTEE